MHHPLELSRSRFPLWVVLPAVLAGNTVVFKPAEQTPICGHKLMELFEEAGFPAGVINLVQGMGEEVGDPLVRHQRRGRGPLHRLPRRG